MNKSLVYTVIVIILIAAIAAFFFIPSKTKDFTVKDPSSCNKIQNIEERDNCLFNVAVNIGDEEACNFLSKDKDKCFELVATGFNKFDLCAQIQDKGLSANCLLAKNQEKGFESCEDLGASVEGDEVQNKLVIDSCYINIFLNQDIKPEDCNSISDVNLRTYCQAVTSKNPNSCSSIEESIIFNKIICTTEVARKLDDKKICEILSTEEEIQECKNNLEATL